ncbi:gliding motility-associated C-terminal domain-containing protein [Cellulophaga baltica]|uniref:gliding motility-associated C-terminal domain-containing protein n=1 Tax=Cellulophaga baltica TaxID=76594 RepID=UPI0024956789|nr:gliding motility-associated C-terminal domain-containing protein [Cellulophaga baltica]
MTNQNKMDRIPFFLLFIIFFGVHTFSQAQTGCAGSDALLTICNKDQDPSLQNFDLFDALNDTPLTGGIWSTSNPANFYAFDRTTGIVNLWKILNSGTHTFTYTNDACGESADVTINLGGYSGEDNIDGSANACSNEIEVNMHRFLGSEVADKIQDFNGLWEAVTPEAVNFLERNIFNAFGAGPGVYEFTYTVAAVATCPSEQSTVILEVHPSPNPGTGLALAVCVTDDLSAYRNLNLNSYLAAEDANGTWSESGTGQLTDLSDNTINVEEIRDNFGYGIYNFNYTVYPTHPVCDEQFSTVAISILPTLSGSLESLNYCIGSPYTIDITYDSTLLPNGRYQMGYLVDPADALVRAEDVIITLTDGVGSFDVNPSLVSTNVYNTVSISSITGFLPLRSVCTTIDVSETTFLVSNSQIQIAEACQDTTIPVQILNILDTTASLTNSPHTITYTLTAPDGGTTTETIENLAFSAGAATFEIAAEHAGQDGEHEVMVTIDNVLDVTCNLQTLFNVIATPDAITLTLQVDNSCNATEINVLVAAPILPDGIYNVTYDVIEQNTGAVVINNTIAFAGGTADYQVDVAPLEQGNYTISVRSIQNDTTPCRTIFEYEETENFAIKGIPDIPIGESNQTFCLSEYDTNGPTLENLAFTASGDPLFYATESSTDILSISTPLAHNVAYFISTINNENNCEGTQRLRVLVSLTAPIAPTTSNASPFFCGGDAATLASVDITFNETAIAWYDAPVNGNLLPATTLLEDGVSYYAASENSQGCRSSERLLLTPTVFTVTPLTLASTEFDICGLDKPTISDLNNLAAFENYEIRWYDSLESTSAISETALLIPYTMYYAENYNEDTGCIAPNRTAITIDLSACNPEDYDFFIPDGFSPNGDARNDRYFIPNIEKIFPAFQLEIKNRYGRTLFMGNIQNPVWDGTIKGNSIAPNGVYFYIIHYNKEGFEPKQGRLFLNR